MNVMLYQKYLVNVIKKLLNLQNAIESKEEILHFHQLFVQSVEEYIHFCFQNNLPHPKKKSEYLSFFYKKLSKYGTSEALSITAGQDIPIIDAGTGQLETFWQYFLEEDEYYADIESNNFYAILDAIRTFDNADSLMKSFINFRHFLSNPDSFCIVTKEKRDELLADFDHPDYAEIQKLLHNFFFQLPASTFYTLCPHCNNRLQKEKNNYQCIHWRCNALIRKKVENNEELKTYTTNSVEIEYTFLPWVFKYIRIPGIEEFRIAKETRFVIDTVLKKNQHDESVNVIPNPDNDRVDILIESDIDILQADIKDFEFAFHLSEKLLEYKSIKVGSLNRIYVVIPYDTTTHGSTDYIKSVNSRIQHDKPFLTAISERQWYDLVRKSIKERVIDNVN